MGPLVETFLLTLGALVPIVNPLSTAPLFVSLTGNMERSEKSTTAFQAALFAFVVLATFLILGDTLIDFFGISIAGIRIAGGLVIAIIGIQMLFPQFGDLQGPIGPTDPASVALSPLAIPNISGPGSIAAVISIGSNIPSTNQIPGYVAVLGAIAVVMVVVYIIYMSAAFLANRLGRSLIDGITRIMGFLLVAIGVQFVAIGIFKYHAAPPTASVSRHWSPDQIKGHYATSAREVTANALKLHVVDFAATSMSDKL